jgi:hypothetical protein
MGRVVSTDNWRVVVRFLSANWLLCATLNGCEAQRKSDSESGVPNPGAVLCEA